MKKIILLLILAFAILNVFAQSENSKLVDAKGVENIVQKTIGNLIIQTIPLAVEIEIPKMGIVGDKIQDSIILEEINTGVYNLAFRLKKKKYHCSVEVLNQKTIHLLVDIKKKKFETKEIKYIPHLPDPIPVDTSTVYVIIDEMPEFPGGEEELKRYIAMSVRYPVEAFEKGIVGRVFVTFVVNKKGEIEGVRVVRSVDPALDVEAVRAVSCLPTWKPGRQKGKLVKVSYTIPINFEIK